MLATLEMAVPTILESSDAHNVFDSSKIPGEIIDLMVANTEVLKDNPNFGKALVGIWYETVAKMKADKALKEAMAQASGTDVKGFDEMLITTEMFYEPKAAVAFTTSSDLKTTTGRVSLDGLAVAA